MGGGHTVASSGLYDPVLMRYNASHASQTGRKPPGNQYPFSRIMSLEPPMPDRIYEHTKLEIAAAIARVEYSKEWKRKKRMQTLLEKTCPHCDKHFVQRREWQTFCTDKCRTEFHKKKLQRDVEALSEENAALRAERDRLLTRVQELESK